MDADPRLDGELARLVRADLEPLAARALHVAALRRLARGPAPRRCAALEARVLVGLSTAHVLWAVLRVCGLSGP